MIIEVKKQRFKCVKTLTYQNRSFYRKIYFYRFVWDEDDAADTWYEEICFRDLTELKSSNDGYVFVQCYTSVLC